MLCCAVEQDRLCFSVLWEMTPNAEIIKTSFHKTVVHSMASLCYGDAQSVIEGKTPADSKPWGKDVLVLHEMAKRLRAKRMVNGALTLASPQV